MKTKKILMVALLATTFGVTGCANKSMYSGDVHSGRSAKTAQSVTYGQIVSVRPVTIQAESSGVIGGVGGGVIGGIAGSGIGGGKGRDLATAAGAVLGAVAGSKIEDKANQVQALEIEVRTDDGRNLVVVQRADRQWSPGQRVRLIGSGNTLSVAPAY
ncbi:MAG TPA: glycine zipper 2TM domain-containing protein [Alcanivoracaceae bacterium]|nr:glycine zipper 2TM domain-containing protein [Alcanivoracaceae bacterium]